MANNQRENSGLAAPPLTQVVDGIYPELGALSPSTLISEDGLAHLLGKGCRETIKRAVARGELPRPAKLMGKNMWTVGSITRFLEAKVEEETSRVNRMGR